MKLIQLNEKLSRINWDFKNATTQYGTHNYHWYLSTFVPQIPNILITNLSKKNEKIIDPFCGSGTTLVEAMMLNRNATGVDINPFSILITKVKTNPIKTKELKEHIKNFRKKLEIYIKQFKHNKKTRETILNFVPQIPDKNKWYHKKTLEELAIIYYTIFHEIKDKDIRDFFIVAFSDRLNYCSVHSKRIYGYIADNCINKDYELSHVDAIRSFNNKIDRMFDKMKNLNEDIERKKIDAKIDYSLADSNDLSFIKDKYYHFVITSPPYPLATDYTKGFRLSFYWLNDIVKDTLKENGRNSIRNKQFNFTDPKSLIKEFVSNEIGPRAKRHQKKIIELYLNNIKKSTQEIYRILKDDRYFCLIFGNTGRYYNDISIENHIQNIYEDIGFRLEIQPLKRNISNHRNPYKNIGSEKIYIYKKT